MQADIPQILWHDEKNKIMSIDFYPNSTKHFLTASFVTDQDSGIRFWELKDKQETSGAEFKMEPTFLYDLANGHQKSVNCVRFSPNGQYIASGADDQLVILWSLKSVPVEFGRLEEKIQWGQPKQLRGHVGDVMDISWANDSSYFVTGSLDNTVILWSIAKMGRVQTFEGHKKFVQGVSLHPLMKLIVSASSDATVRVYKNRKLKNKQEFFLKFTVKQREELEESATATAKKEIESAPEEKLSSAEANKVKAEENKENEQGENQIPSGTEAKRETSDTQKKAHRLFLDDTEYQSFVRRLSWSPDGSFMLTPGSWFQDLTQQSEKFQYTVYGFLKHSINKPAFMLPGMKTHANCIRFSPLLLELTEKKDESPALIDLPYAMIFAVATIDQVIVYTTQSINPIAVIKNLHYDSINDLAWMGNRILAIASSDGFCSFIKIEESLVGKPLHWESPVMPEAFKDHYKNQSEIHFQKSVEEAKQDTKEQAFMPITFKSKRETQQKQQQPEQPVQPKPEEVKPATEVADGQKDVEMN